MANFVTACKKGDKQLINNYRPVSLLPIYAKVFNKIIFQSLSEYLDINKLLKNNQSEFRPDCMHLCMHYMPRLYDCCMHQLLSISHEIYKLFDANSMLEVTGVFLTYLKLLAEFGMKV